MMLTGEKLARRQQIEIRIEAYRDNATSSLLEIGRQLNAAKDEGVVPHGEWGAWVAEHAFMSERTAQAWMQAARELPPGSPLERLGIAKIRTLLTLPAGDREETAEKIGAQELSSREGPRDPRGEGRGAAPGRGAEKEDPRQCEGKAGRRGRRHCPDAR